MAAQTDPQPVVAPVVRSHFSKRAVRRSYLRPEAAQRLSSGAKEEARSLSVDAVTVTMKQHLVPQ